jgi:hypothetical protein
MTNNLPAKQEENRDNLGRFKKGQSGNPEGRPKGSIKEVVDQALEEVATKKGKSIFQHIVERAYLSDKVAIALMNKLIPNVKPKEQEEKEDTEIIVSFAHNREEQQCLDEVFETWKANKDKEVNNAK